MSSVRKHVDYNLTLILERGTMTPYSILTDLNVDKSEVEYPGYRPIKVWFMGRHGPRYPEGKILKGMFNVLPKIKKEILAQGADNPCYSKELKQWDPQSNLELDGERLSREETAYTHTPSTEIPAPHETEFEDGHEIQLPVYVKSLTMQGRATMMAMGQRFRERFGGIIPPKLDSKTEIVFTKTLRTRESATNFAFGLFGEDPPEDCPHLREVEKHHKVLKFDSVCSYWKLMVKRKPKMSKIFKDYEDGNEMSSTLKEVRERCSLKTLDQKGLMRIYSMCTYELGWYDKSPWCKFLLERHRQVLEYVEDLKLFNHCAYGNEMNYRIACPMFNDMFNFLTEQNEGLFRFNFSHAKSLIKFSAHLGLFESNEGLRADNYKNKDEREWASSRFAGFGFNFTFVLYELINNTNERAILLMLNEHPIKIPRCKEVVETYLCPLEIFEKIFEDSIRECHYDKWCQNEKYGSLYEQYLRMKKENRYDDSEIFSLLGIPNDDSSDVSHFNQSKNK